MARILVTGGCGFIGSHVVEQLLARGDTVRVLDDLSTGRRDNLPSAADLILGDVADPQTVARAMNGVTGCIHLAAIASVTRSNEDWLGTHQTNLSGTITVFDAAAKAGQLPVVYASSAAVYGDCADLPLSEAAPTRPLSAYGADKLGCELHARVAGLVHGLPTTGLRPFNVFGPRQDPKSSYSGVISIFAEKLRRGEPITMFGDGTQVRDFIYVEDVARLILAALTIASVTAPVVNACTGRGTTVTQLAEMLGRLTGQTPEIHHAPPRDGDIRASIGNPSRTRELLGLTTPVTLEDGLTRLLATL